MNTKQQLQPLAATASTPGAELVELYVVYHQDVSDPAKMNMTLYGEVEEGGYYELQIWSAAKQDWIPVFVEGPIPAGKTSLDWSMQETGTFIVKARWVKVERQV